MISSFIIKLISEYLSFDSAAGNTPFDDSIFKMSAKGRVSAPGSLYKPHTCFCIRCGAQKRSSGFCRKTPSESADRKNAPGFRCNA
ncbi:MAG TPA: hypothetical protein DCP68_05100 [Ruminococcus sp.]|nr:hypothetical protein [Ruminococcus sp.]